jgi:hypothetical protein
VTRIGFDRATWTKVAGVVLAILVMLLLARQVLAEWRALDREILDQFHLDPLLLVAAWLVQTVGWLLVVDTWRRIVGNGLSLGRHLRLYSYSALAYVLPGSIWVPVGRVMLYRQAGVPVVTTGAAVAVEWILLGVAGLVLYGLAAPFSSAVPPNVAPLLAIGALSSVVVLHESVFGRVVGAASRLLGDEVPPPPLAGSTLLVLAIRQLGVLTLSGVSLYLFMLGVAPAASLPDAMAATSWTMAVSNLLAWLPATAVVKDGGMVLMLSPMYGSTVVALAVALAWRVWLTLASLSWAGLAALVGGRGRQVAEEAQ